MRTNNTLRTARKGTPDPKGGDLEQVPPAPPCRVGRTRHASLGSVDIAFSSRLLCVMGIRALVGTRKGLFMINGDDDRRNWQASGPRLDGWAVYHATVDPRDGTIYAGGQPFRIRPDSSALGGRRDYVEAVSKDRPAR
jgi:hypothetical protein